MPDLMVDMSSNDRYLSLNITKFETTVHRVSLNSRMVSEAIARRSATVQATQ